jgi:ATP-dependent protease ClpP protease subunit
MKDFRPTAFIILLVLGLGIESGADTFTHRRSSEVLHGYSTGIKQYDKTIVHTEQKGVVELDLAQWRVTSDVKGRNNKVFVLSIDDKVMLEIETEALIEALSRTAAQGPLFIILQIDTPGGRVDYARRICAAITQIRHCPIYAFANGGAYGGALSAGAAVAFACDKVYMASASSIGAASTVALVPDGPADFEELYGKAVAEKVNSAWRAYLASLAEQNRRPGLLAGAMVDKNLEVIEVKDNENRAFIDPVDRKPQQQLVHTWSKKGSLLTLTARQAANCGIADKVVKSRPELLRLLGAEGAELVIDNSFQKAGRLFKKAKQRYDKISRRLDLRIKQMRQAHIPFRTRKMLRDIQKDYKSLIALAKRYSDLSIDVQALQRQLNSAEAFYKETKPSR